MRAARAHALPPSYTPARRSPDLLASPVDEHCRTCRGPRAAPHAPRRHALNHGTTPRLPARLGALPLFFVGHLDEYLAALANALACGVMMAASFDLVHEARARGAARGVLRRRACGALCTPTQAS